MKRFSLLPLLLIWMAFQHRVYAQSRTDIPELQQPRLVVGLVVDQMRWDYLVRFADRFGEGGFRRLMRDGYNCNRTLINYIPAITAVGHTSVYTGSVPALTGIVGNNFYVDGKPVYCTADTTVRSLGTLDEQGLPDAAAWAGQESPRNLMVTTITDELRMATNFRSKVIGVALKDRAAILPAGHAANAAYWLDANSMNFISSSYYMEELPEWVRRFNARKLGEQYMRQMPADRSQGLWPLLYDEQTYVQSASRNQAWEDEVKRSLKYSPWGMTFTFDMAKAAVEAEQLGHNPDGVPDFLAVSISTTDMLGHLLSPNSIWMEDLFLRLDRDVAAFLSFLDERVGQGNYLFFLTADHGGMHNTEFLRQHRLYAATWGGARRILELNAYLQDRFPQFVRPVETMNNMQLYFASEVLQSPQRDAVLQAAADYLATLPEISYAFPLSAIPTNIPEPVRSDAVNGYCPQRSGQVQLIFRPGVMEDYSSVEQLRSAGHIRKGTTHSVWSPDDTHIPLIFMGFGVPHGWDNRTHHITDIAPTLAALLNIQQPNACVGEVIDFVTQP